MRMDYPIRQGRFRQNKRVDPVRCRPGLSHRVNVRLLIETALVTAAVIVALRFLLTPPLLPSDRKTRGQPGWYVAPAVLLAAGLIPTLIKKGQFPSIGLRSEQVRRSLVVLAGVCIFIFPALTAGLWLLKLYGIQSAGWLAPLPLRPVLPREQGLAGWLLYQFLYVAVAEEVFFRGYVQYNFLHLVDPVESRSRKPRHSDGGVNRLAPPRGGGVLPASIIISAACFALAHTIVQGQIVSVLTFLPGLILGWLFVRTGTLLAPILFHGLANTWYLVICGLLANL